MFGGLPTNAFSSPAPWHGGGGGGGGDDDEGGNSKAQPPAPAAVAPSPGDLSLHNGSTGTGPGEEKDPFLSLLEQLAESESFRGQGNELDFFLGAGAGTG